MRQVEGGQALGFEADQIPPGTLHVNRFNVTADDRYTLPSRFDPQQPKAINIDHETDENGPHHEVVMF